MPADVRTAATIAVLQPTSPADAGRGRKRADPTTSSLLLAAPLGLFFVAIFVAPLLILVFVSLHDDAGMTRVGLAQYVKFLTDPFSLEVLGHTLWLGVEVTALCLVLGYPLASLSLMAKGSP